jgi:hypothetical protein
MSVNNIALEEASPSTGPAEALPLERVTHPPRASSHDDLFASVILMLFATLPDRTKDLAVRAAKEVMKHVKARGAIGAARRVVGHVPKDAVRTIREVLAEREELRAARARTRDFLDPYGDSGARRLARRRDELPRFRRERTWTVTMNYLETLQD